MSVLRGIVIVAGAAVTLFVGSAVVSGILDANAKRRAQELSTRLTSINRLQNMVLEAVKKRDGVSVPCGFVAAIAFRLAEARDLNIEQAYGVDLANDRWLVEEIAKTGSDPRYVIRGLAAQVYGSPLSPADTFKVHAAACARTS